MKTNPILQFAIVILILAGGVLCADRELGRSEILALFAELTQTPCTGWIPQGTIEAVHNEYSPARNADPAALESLIRQEQEAYLTDEHKPEKADWLRKMRLDAIPFNVRAKYLNEWSMSTQDVLKFDGQRFYRELNVLSRQDSLKVPQELTGNYKVARFDLFANQTRIMAWNGSEYITYNLPINDAMVNETARPYNFEGPAAAGLVPWGQGAFTCEGLCEMQSRAFERTISGRTLTELTLTFSADYERTVLLDPARGLTLETRLDSYGSGNRDFYSYENYSRVGGYWVPGRILLEKTDAQGRLKKRDEWLFTTVDTQCPPDADYTPQYRENALVRYPRQGLAYRFTKDADIDALLSLRKAVAARPDVYNCATAAIAYIAERYGVAVSESELSGLINAEGRTNLADFRGYLTGKGLYAGAFHARLEDLEGLANGVIVLYQPLKRHFIILESATDEAYRVLNLTSASFYRPVDKAVFPMDWSEGVMMYVSTAPPTLSPEIAPLSEEDIFQIDAGAGYACTLHIQDASESPCPEPQEGQCEGEYVIYYNVYGCEAAPSGSCSGTFLISEDHFSCNDDPMIPNNCISAGLLYSYYAYGCPPD